MISPATAVILTLTTNRKMFGKDEDFAPFMYNSESRWLLGYWLLTCCFQVQGAHAQDPFNLSTAINSRTAEALGVTLTEEQFPKVDAKFSGRLSALWLERLVVKNKDDPEVLLCEYARRAFDAAVGTTEVHKTTRVIWFTRLFNMIDEAGLKE